MLGRDPFVFEQPAAKARLPGFTGYSILAGNRCDKLVSGKDSNLPRRAVALLVTMINGNRTRQRNHRKAGIEPAYLSIHPQSTPTRSRTRLYGSEDRRVIQYTMEAGGRWSCFPKGHFHRRFQISLYPHPPLLPWLLCGTNFNYCLRVSQRPSKLVPQFNVCLGGPRIVFATERITLWPFSEVCGIPA